MSQKTSMTWARWHLMELQPLSTELERNVRAHWTQLADDSNFAPQDPGEVLEKVLEHPTATAVDEQHYQLAIIGITKEESYKGIALLRTPHSAPLLVLQCYPRKEGGAS